MGGGRQVSQLLNRKLRPPPHVHYIICLFTEIAVYWSLAKSIHFWKHESQVLLYSFIQFTSQVTVQENRLIS